MSAPLMPSDRRQVQGDEALKYQPVEFVPLGQLTRQITDPVRKRALEEQIVATEQTCYCLSQHENEQCDDR